MEEFESLENFQDKFTFIQDFLKNIIYTKDQKLKFIKDVSKLYPQLQILYKNYIFLSLSQNYSNKIIFDVFQYLNCIVKSNLYNIDFWKEYLDIIFKHNQSIKYVDFELLLSSIQYIQYSENFDQFVTLLFDVLFIQNDIQKTDQNYTSLVKLAILNFHSKNDKLHNKFHEQLKLLRDNKYLNKILQKDKVSESCLEEIMSFSNKKDNKTLGFFNNILNEKNIQIYNENLQNLQFDDKNHAQFICWNFLNQENNDEAFQRLLYILVSQKIILDLQFVQNNLSYWLSMYKNFEFNLIVSNAISTFCLNQKDNFFPQFIINNYSQSFIRFDLIIIILGNLDDFQDRKTVYSQIIQNDKNFDAHQKPYLVNLITEDYQQNSQIDIYFAKQMLKNFREYSKPLIALLEDNPLSWSQLQKNEKAEMILQYLVKTKTPFDYITNSPIKNVLDLELLFEVKKELF